MEKTSKGESPLDKVESEHPVILEEMEVLRELLPYIGNQESFENVKEVMKFIEKTFFAHINYEESRLFSIALVIGELEIKQIVRELQIEHIRFFSSYDTLKDIVLKHGFSFEDENVKESFIRAAMEIIELVLPHARKEDEKLFPYLRTKGIDIDLSKISH
ncbi:MAG: hemerythrin domain-containing protein [Candidatus Omnitrophota bacterium]